MIKLNSSKRNAEIDILKGIGILLVVILHIGLPSMFWSNFFGAFHMAIFIFCSGYCFKAKNFQDTPFKYCLRKLKSLYFPYVSFCVFLILFNNFFVSCNIYTDNIDFLSANIGIANFYGLTTKLDFSTMLKEIGAIILFGQHGQPQLAGAIWFLRVLFVITVSFYIIQYLTHKLFPLKFEIISKWFQLSISALFLVIGWFGQNSGKNKLQVFTCCSIYFIYVAGWRLAQTDISTKLRNTYVALVTIIICFLILKIVTPESNIGISANIYSSIAHLVVASLAGVILFFALSIQIAKTKYLRIFLCNLGGASLYIMMFHFIAFKIVTQIEIMYYQYPPYYLAAFPVLITNGWWRILYIFVGCFVPSIIGISLVWVKKHFICAK